MAFTSGLLLVGFLGALVHRNNIGNIELVVLYLWIRKLVVTLCTVFPKNTIVKLYSISVGPVFIRH